MQHINLMNKLILFSFYKPYPCIYFVFILYFKLSTFCLWNAAIQHCRRHYTNFYCNCNCNDGTIIDVALLPVPGKSHKDIFTTVSYLISIYIYEIQNFSIRHVLPFLLSGVVTAIHTVL